MDSLKSLNSTLLDEMDSLTETSYEPNPMIITNTTTTIKYENVALIVLVISILLFFAVKSFRKKK